MKIKEILLFLAVLLSSIELMAAKSKKKSVFVKITESKEIFDTFSYPARVTSGLESTLLAEGQGVVLRIHKGLGKKVSKKEGLVSIKRNDPVYKYRPIKQITPIKGVIGQVYVTEGSVVAKGQRLLLVTDPDKKRILIEVSSRDTQFIREGLKGEFRFDSLDKIFPVEVIGVSPYIDPATGTATAELKLISPSNEFPIGGIGKVNFKSNIHQGFVLPADSIQYQGKEKFVKVVRNGSVIKKVKIKIGPKRRGQVEVLEGLNEKDEVVIRSSGFLKEGSEVIIKNKKKTEIKEKKKDKV